MVGSNDAFPFELRRISGVFWLFQGGYIFKWSIFIAMLVYWCAIQSIKAVHDLVWMLRFIWWKVLLKWIAHRFQNNFLIDVGASMFSTCISKTHLKNVSSHIAGQTPTKSSPQNHHAPPQTFWKAVTLHWKTQHQTRKIENITLNIENIRS